MNSINNTLNKYFRNDCFKRRNNWFAKIISNLDYYFIENENDYNDVIASQINSSSIIIFAENEKLKGKYFVVIFDKTIIIILQEKLYLLDNFFSNHKNSTIYMMNDQTKDHFNENMKQNEKDLIIDTENKYGDEIESLAESFNFFEKKLDYYWDIIRVSISSYLLIKSHQESKIDRLKNCSELLEKPAETVQFEREDIVEIKVIGYGGSSIVYLIYHFKKEKLFALKKFISSNSKLIEREMKNYSYLYHPFLLRFFCKMENDSLVFEYIEGHTLLDIKNRKIQLQENDKIKIIFQIMIVFQYIHQNGYIYRDLKPNNIMLDHNNIPILIDLDRAIQNSEEENDEYMTRYFSEKYTPPEINKKKSFTYKYDVYTLGKLIYYIIREKDPKTGIDSYDEFPQEYSIIKDICNKCTFVDPNQRPTLNNVIEEFYKYFVYKNSIPINEIDEITSNKEIHSSNFNYYWILLTEANAESFLSLGKLYNFGHDLDKNIQKAIEYYKLAARSNISDGYYYLGLIYENNDGIKQDYSTAKGYYELSARQNNAKSIYRLGYLYMKGYGVQQDYLKAKEYFLLSAKQNNSNALLELGNIYFDGLGIEKDYIKAKEYFEQSAKHNNFYAYYNLAIMYEKGIGCHQDLSKAKKLYKLSAQKNDHTNILVNLGDMYFQGHLFKQNYSKAKYYYEIALKENNPRALNNLGMIYLHGYSVEKDYLKAKHYFELAAKQNVSMSYVNLGLIYANGYGVKQNFFKAKDYYELAVEKNNCYAQFNLGLMYEKGLGVDKNYNLAKEYYELAAKQNLPEAICNLGFLYEKGNGVKINYDKAKYYYDLAALKNSSSAFLHLGNLYENGHGVKQDYNAAKYFYELAAQQKNHSAYSALSYLYLMGYGIERDYKKFLYYNDLSGETFDPEKKAIEADDKIYDYIYEIACRFESGEENILPLIKTKVKSNKLAKKYFELAASKGNSKALNRLGDFYFYGIECRKDYLKAKEFYEKSAEKGNRIALYNLGNLYFKGNGVKYDYFKAKKYFELSAEFLYMPAYVMIGYIYEKGLVSPIDYLKAREMYEIAEKHNEPSAYVRLSNLYLHGYGVEKNCDKALNYLKMAENMQDPTSYYLLGYIYEFGLCGEKNIKKAKYYYELSAQNDDSESLLWLGYFYFNGKGGKKDYFAAKYYYEQSAKLNNPLAYYELARFIYYEFLNYSDLSKVIYYYLKCIEILDKANTVDDEFRFHSIIYLSYNDLGLLYITVFKDIEKATNCFTKSSLGNYSYGQNNLGLLYQYYLNQNEKAKSMYKRASKHNFAMASYNLGYMKEKEGNFKEATIFYIKASHDENDPLMFNGSSFNDPILNISKTFVIILANLKLVETFLIIKNFDESKKYFMASIRSYVKYTLFDYWYCFTDIIDYFSDIKWFILGLPFFNLENQKYFKLNIGRNSMRSEIEKIMKKLKIQNNESKNGDDKFEEKEEEEELDEKSILDCFVILFEYVITSNRIRELFIKNIRETIKLMTKILNTPPYAILFGQINVKKPKKIKKEKVYPYMKEINEIFYEGFGIEI